MKIESKKLYKVTKFFSNKDEVYNLGQLPGEDVKRLLQGYKYDEDFEMWFSTKGTIGYDVVEVK